jgi:hypothetical protein
MRNPLLCIYYNIISNFYILLNIFLPYYSEEILNLQYKTIEYINEDIIFESNSRKRRRFNIFIENLINKNNELIEKIRKQEEEDNDINNYQKMNKNYDEILDENVNSDENSGEEENVNSGEENSNEEDKKYI